MIQKVRHNLEYKRMGFLRKEHICVEGVYETKEIWKSESIDKTHILKP